MRKSLQCLAMLAVVMASRGASAPMSAAAPPEASQPTALDLRALRGHVVLVDFCAAWCQPCRKSLPWMNGLLGTYGKAGLVIIAVDVDKDRPLGEAFLAKRHPDMRVVFDPDGKLAKAYALEGMPSSFLYDRNGVLRQTHLGFVEKDAKKLEKAITTLLEEKSEAP